MVKSFEVHYHGMVTLSSEEMHAIYNALAAQGVRLEHDIRRLSEVNVPADMLERMHGRLDVLYRAEVALRNGLTRYETSE